MRALFYPEVPGQSNDYDKLYIPHILEEIYIKKVYEKYMERDSVIVDAGANCGLTTQYFRQFAKIVHAIEPSFEHFEALRRNKSYNHWDNVTIHNVALSNQTEQTTFYISSANRTANSLLIWDGIPDANPEQLIVQAISFADFIHENNIQYIDFLKMDIEGAEELVLTTPEFKDFSPHIKYLFLEFHTNKYTELISSLVNMGFKHEAIPVQTTTLIFSH